LVTEKGHISLIRTARNMVGITTVASNSLNVYDLLDNNAVVMPEDVIKKMSKISKFLVITIPNSAFYRFRLQLLFGRFLKQWVLHPSEHLRF